MARMVFHQDDPLFGKIILEVHRLLLAHDNVERQDAENGIVNKNAKAREKKAREEKTTLSILKHINEEIRLNNLTTNLHHIPRNTSH